MNRIFSLVLLSLALAGLAACGDDHGHEDDHGHDHEDAHGHDHEDGGNHEDDHDDHEHGERIELGTADAGGQAVTAALLGEIEAGHEAVLDIEVKGAPPATVRAWVGVESGRGSLKARLDSEDGDFHGHVEVPAKLPVGSAIWIELEAPSGKRSRVSFKVPDHS